MKKIVALFVAVVLFLSCDATKKSSTTREEVVKKVSDTVRIANDEIEYEIMIIDPGFSAFLYGQAKPREYYSLEILEQRNQVYVREWNNRARLPLSYNPQLYEMEINYDSSIRYGYEVNYLLYNYFVFFQSKF